MKCERFNEVVKTMTDLQQKVLLKKASEYATDDDRLFNFKRAAASLGCTPEMALLGMLVKHIVSVVMMVEDIEKGRFRNDMNVWDEKLGDIQNYCTLLKGLVIERQETAAREDIINLCTTPVTPHIEFGWRRSRKRSKRKRR